MQKWIKPLDNQINDISPKSSAAKAAPHSANLSGDELPLSLAGFDLAQGLLRLRGNQKSFPPQKMLEQQFYTLEHALNQALESAQSLEADNEDMPMKIALEEMAKLPAELANDVAKRMHTYAEMGDVMQLVQIADELKSRAEVYGPISDGIARMAWDFDFESILILANELKE